MQLAVEHLLPRRRGQPRITGAELPGVAATRPQFRHGDITVGHFKLHHCATRLSQHGEHLRAGQAGLMHMAEETDPVLLLERQLLAEQAIDAKHR